METNLDLLRTIDTGAPAPQRPFRTLHLAIALLIVAAALAFTMRPVHQSSASANIGAVAYCVTSDGSPAQSGLHTALYTAGTTGLELYDAGSTDHNGCGVFNYVPVDEIFFVTAWSSDGVQVGNSSWFESGAMVVAPTVQLDTPGFYNRLALH